MYQTGKVHFGYIYGFGALGTIGIYVIANLMSPAHPLDVSRTFSILGYCLLPIVALAAFSILINLRGVVGKSRGRPMQWSFLPRHCPLLHPSIVLLCGRHGPRLCCRPLVHDLCGAFLRGGHAQCVPRASHMLYKRVPSALLSLIPAVSHQKWLIAYPCFLLYACFALMAIF